MQPTPSFQLEDDKDSQRCCDCTGKWDVNRVLGRLQRVCVIQAVANLIYVVYVLVTEVLFTSLTIVIILSAVASVCLGTWGFMAAKKKSRARLIVYLLASLVISSATIGANITFQWALHSSCSLEQSSYKNCGDLDCAKNSSCTVDFLKDLPCQAPGKEICESDDPSRYLAAILIQLFAAALPTAFSFTAVVRIQKIEEDMEATYGKSEKFQVSQAGAAVNNLSQPMLVSSLESTRSASSSRQDDQSSCVVG